MYVENVLGLVVRSKKIIIILRRTDSIKNSTHAILQTTVDFFVETQIDTIPLIDNVDDCDYSDSPEMSTN